jgi:hypothetical protein
MVDRELVKGASLARVSRVFNLSYNSLWLHKQNHIHRQLAKSYEMAQVKSDIDLLGTIDDILKKSQVIFDRNFEAGKDLTALKALDGTRATIQLLSQISAQLHQAKQLELDREAQEAEEVDKKENGLKAQLAILTTEELCLLERLHNKIKHQNKDQIIVDGRVTPHWLNPDKYE